MVLDNKIKSGIIVVALLAVMAAFDYYGSFSDSSAVTGAVVSRYNDEITGAAAIDLTSSSGQSPQPAG